MLHLIVPAKDDTPWTLFLRKLRWLALAILAPELLVLFASGQWALSDPLPRWRNWYTPVGH